MGANQRPTQQISATPASRSPGSPVTSGAAVQGTRNNQAAPNAPQGATVGSGSGVPHSTNAGNPPQQAQSSPGLLRRGYNALSRGWTRVEDGIVSGTTRIGNAIGDGAYRVLGPASQRTIDAYEQSGGDRVWQERQRTAVRVSMHAATVVAGEGAIAVVGRGAQAVNAARTARAAQGARGAAQAERGLALTQGTAETSATLEVAQGTASTGRAATGSAARAGATHGTAETAATTAGTTQGSATAGRVAQTTQRAATAASETAEQIAARLFQSPVGQGSANEVLGVSSSATRSEIIAAYRRLLIRVHPDIVAGDRVINGVAPSLRGRVTEILQQRAAAETVRLNEAREAALRAAVN